jgi:hypothetical protein
MTGTTQAQKPQAQKRQLGTLADAAEKAGGVHPRTVRRWIASGLLAGYRAGPKLLMVDLDELDRVIRPIPAGRT